MSHPLPGRGASPMPPISQKGGRKWETRVIRPPPPVALYNRILWLKREKNTFSEDQKKSRLAKVTAKRKSFSSRLKIPRTYPDRVRA